MLENKESKRDDRQKTREGGSCVCVRYCVLAREGKKQNIERYEKGDGGQKEGRRGEFVQRTSHHPTTSLTQPRVCSKKTTLLPKNTLITLNH
jgi:hypothetical protein